MSCVGKTTLALPFLVAGFYIQVICPKNWSEKSSTEIIFFTIPSKNGMLYSVDNLSFLECNNTSVKAIYKQFV